MGRIMQATGQTPPQAAPQNVWGKLYGNYYVRTLFQSLLTILAVITFTFFLVRLMPGNPVDVLR